MAVISCEACGEMHHRLHKCNSVAEAELRGYQRGIADAFKAVGGDSWVSSKKPFSESVLAHEKRVLNQERARIRAKLQALRGGGKPNA